MKKSIALSETAQIAVLTENPVQRGVRSTYLVCGFGKVGIAGETPTNRLKKVTYDNIIGMKNHQRYRTYANVFGATGKSGAASVRISFVDSIISHSRLKLKKCTIFQGDSGNGLFDESRHLIGVYSQAKIPCGQVPDVYSEIEPYLDWIRETITVCKKGKCTVQ